MPRGTIKFRAEASKDYVAPVYLLRLLNIQPISTGEAQSLYLNDTVNDIEWFDENGDVGTYLAAPSFRYENIEIDSKNPISGAKIYIDNVKKTLSAMAQYYKLNNTTVHVFRGFRNTLDTIDGAQLLMIGHIKSCVISETSFSADVTNDFSLKVRIPRRLYSVNDFAYLPAAKDVRQIFTG